MAKGNKQKEQSAFIGAMGDYYLALDGQRILILTQEYANLVNFPSLVYDCVECPKTGCQETYYAKTIDNTLTCDDCGGILQFRASNLELLEQAKSDKKKH